MDPLHIHNIWYSQPGSTIGMYIFIVWILSKECKCYYWCNLDPNISKIVYINELEKQSTLSTPWKESAQRTRTFQIVASQPEEDFLCFLVPTTAAASSMHTPRAQFSAFGGLASSYFRFCRSGIFFSLLTFSQS